MSLNYVELPFDYFPNLNKGRPLFGGKIYVGEVGTDPSVEANQKQIYIQEAYVSGTTPVPVSQPLTISSGGVPQYNGSPVIVTVDGDYSILVLDKDDSQEYYYPSVRDGVPLSVNSLGNYTDYVFNSVAEMRSGVTIGSETVDFVIGNSVKTIGYHSATSGGGANYTIVAAGTGVEDSGEYINLDNGLQAKLIHDGVVSVTQYGAKSDGSDAAVTTPAFIGALTKFSSIYVPEGVYAISTTLGSFSDKTIFGDNQEVTRIVADTESSYLIELTRPVIKGLTFESVGDKSDGLNRSGVSAVGQSHISDCIFTGFSGFGLGISAQYACLYQRNKFASNGNGIQCLVAPGWGEVSTTSVAFLANEFFQNDVGYYADDTHESWLPNFQSCLFHYNQKGIYINSGRPLRLELCWFEQNTVYGAELLGTELVVLSCRYVTATDEIIQDTANISKGYIEHDFSEAAVTARYFNLTNEKGKNESGSNPIHFHNSGSAVLIRNSSFSQDLYMKVALFQTKDYACSYNYSDSGFNENNTGFTLTRLDVGKYRVEFNQTMVDPIISIAGHKAVSVSPDGSTYTASDITKVGWVATASNSGDLNNFSTITGMVIFLTNASDVAVDGLFFLTVKQPNDNIYTY